MGSCRRTAHQTLTIQFVAMSSSASPQNNSNKKRPHSDSSGTDAKKWKESERVPSAVATKIGDSPNPQLVSKVYREGDLTDPDEGGENGIIRCPVCGHVQTTMVFLGVFRINASGVECNVYDGTAWSGIEPPEVPGDVPVDPFLRNKFERPVERVKCDCCWETDLKNLANHDDDTLARYIWADGKEDVARGGYGKPNWALFVRYHAYKIWTTKNAKALGYFDLIRGIDPTESGYTSFIETQRKRLREVRLKRIIQETDSDPI